MVRAVVVAVLAPLMLVFSLVSVAFAEEVQVVDSGADSGSDQPVSVDSVPSDPAPASDSPVGGSDGSLDSDGPADADQTVYDSDGDVLSAPLQEPRAVTGRPYASVTGGTYDALAADVVGKLGQPLDDYLFYRAGNYSYVLAVGDLRLDGTTFTGSGCTVVRFVRDDSFNGYRIEFSTEGVSLDASGYIVRSNLGNYPQLDVGDARLELVAIVCLVLLCVDFVVRPVFAFVSRDRTR